MEHLESRALVSFGSKKIINLCLGLEIIRGEKICGRPQQVPLRTREPPRLRRGGKTLAHSRSAPSTRQNAPRESVSQPATPEGEDENLKLLRAPDWGAVGPLRDPVVGRMHTRQSSRQRARTFAAGAARAKAARVRVAAARPTRKLQSLAHLPPGLSQPGLLVLQGGGMDANSLGSRSNSAETYDPLPF